MVRPPFDLLGLLGILGGRGSSRCNSPSGLLARAGSDVEKSTDDCEVLEALNLLVHGGGCGVLHVNMEARSDEHKADRKEEREELAADIQNDEGREANEDTTGGLNNEEVVVGRELELDANGISGQLKEGGEIALRQHLSTVLRGGYLVKARRNKNSEEEHQTDKAEDGHFLKT